LPVVRREGLLAVLGLTVLLAWLAFTPASQAETYRVTQTSDHAGACNRRCALREAVMAANATPADDKVKLPTGTYTLSIGSPDSLLGCAGDADWGDLDICPDGGKLELIGRGARRTTIDADRIDRVIEVVAGLGEGPAATITGLSMRNGKVALDEGGAIAVGSERPVTIKRSRIVGSRTGNGQDGGGISNGGSLKLVKSVVARNVTSPGGDGGGIASFGTLVVRASTIASNHANNGPGQDGDAGGLNNTGTATIVNSTFSGNTAGDADSSDGGAIYTDGDLSLLNATIAFNKAESGGGIAAVDRAENQQTIQNTLLARNKVFSGGADNCGGFIALVSLGHNLEQGASCDFAGPGDISGPARLGPLADNGGPTKTHALRRRSKAINHGKNSECPSIDQRGVHRPQGRRCDIGAYEHKK